MRLATLVIAALAAFLCSCAGERAQVAADARAGVDAAEETLGELLTEHSLEAAVAKGIGDAMAILHGVDMRLPAAAGVNSADWPAPAMPVLAIKDDPKRFSETAPPEPPRGTPWGTIAAAGGALLWLTGRLAPSIPVLGPLVGQVADGAWAVLAHTNQKAAEQGRVQAAAAATAVQPIAQVLTTAIQAGTLPPQIAQHVTPDLSAALAALAGGLSPIPDRSTHVAPA